MKDRESMNNGTLLVQQKTRNIELCKNKGAAEVLTNNLDNLVSDLNILKYHDQ